MYLSVVTDKKEWQCGLVNTEQSLDNDKFILRFECDDGVNNVPLDVEFRPSQDMLNQLYHAMLAMLITVEGR